MVLKCLYLHIRWVLIAFSTSPAKTCRPGQNADKESIVKYAASPVWMLTFLNFSKVQRNLYLKLGEQRLTQNPLDALE